MAVSKVILNGTTLIDVTQKTVTSDSMLSGTTALKNDGTDISGSITSQAAQTIYPSTADQTIASGKYLTGAQTIKGVLLTNLSASNIASGVTVKVGDSADDDRIISVTGTYSGGGGEDTFWAYAQNGLYSVMGADILSSDTASRISGRGVFALESITKISLPSCRTISEYAFYSCSQLSEIYLPSCNTIGAYAFASCTKLTAVELPALTVTTYTPASSAFASCTKLSIFSAPKLGQVSPGMFAGCSSLNSIYIPSCSSIAAYAFGDTGTLADFYAPSVTSIGQAAFHRCKIVSISSGMFPNFSGELQSNVFASCLSLAYVEMASVTRISEYAFSNCTKLVSVSFPACSMLRNNVFTNCKSLADMYFPICTSIGKGAFFGCTGLVSISFPELMYLSSQADGFGTFSGCTSLASVYLPKLTSIPGGTFYSCSALSVARFDAVSQIGSNAFYRASNLRSLYLLSTEIVALGASAQSVFVGTPLLNSSTTVGAIYVRSSLYNTYRYSAVWASASNRFVSLTDEEIAALNPW